MYGPKEGTISCLNGDVRLVNGGVNHGIDVKIISKLNSKNMQ